MRGVGVGVGVGEYIKIWRERIVCGCGIVDFIRVILTFLLYHRSFGDEWDNIL